MANGGGLTERIDLAEYDIEERYLGRAVQLRGHRLASSFLLEYSFEFERQVGYTADEVELEPDTFCIHYVQSDNRPGLGTAVTALAIAKAKKRGYSTGRMGINHPRMIGVVEKLQRLDLVQTRYLIPRHGAHVKPLLPTAEFATSPHLTVSAEEAFRMFAEAEEQARPYAEGKLPPELCFSVDCVIQF